MRKRIQAIVRKDRALWTVDMPGVGVTQAEDPREVVQMAADLVDIKFPGQAAEIDVLIEYVDPAGQMHTERA